jgi:hypothetical protein
MNRFALCCAAIAALGLPASAQAQSSADAESLFREARALVKAGRIAEACDAFAASQRIEPALATLMNLADCREKNRQLASAWGHFLEAESQTRGDRAQERANATARRRAAALESRLSYLVVAVPDDSRVGGLVVSRNGAALDPGMWNRSLPVDGGEYVIEGKAPGHEAWTTRVVVGVEGDRRSVEVPRFKALAPGPRGPVSPIAPANPDVVAERDHADEGEVVEGDAEAAPSWRTGRRVVALGVAGGAVLLAGAGVGLGLHALDLDRQAIAACGDGCSPEVAAASERGRDRARGYALGANLAYAAAATAAVGAGVLWILGGPAGAERADDELAITPTLGAVRGVVVEGRF